jgi:hypothetical protein
MGKFKPVIFGQIHAAGDRYLQNHLALVRNRTCRIPEKTAIARFGGRIDHYW